MYQDHFENKFREGKKVLCRKWDHKLNKYIPDGHGIIDRYDYLHNHVWVKKEDCPYPNGIDMYSEDDVKIIN